MAVHPLRSSSSTGSRPGFEAVLAVALAAALAAGALPTIATSQPAARSEINDRPACPETTKTGKNFGIRTIYGTDDRQDWHEITSPDIRRLSRASVAIVPASRIEGASFTAAPAKPGEIRFKSQKLRKRIWGLCEKERFEDQEALAVCSGTLVRNDLVLTAGHCIAEVCGASCKGTSQPLAGIRFVFGYHVEAAGGAGALVYPARQIYSGVDARGEFESEPGASGPVARRFGKDWALVKLDRPVHPEVAEPVALDFERIAEGRGVFSIGYPSGLPLKHGGGASVRANSHDNIFIANLDTFASSSGSGVFDRSTNRLVGLVVRGGVDYVLQQTGGKTCKRACSCPNTGCDGEDVLRLSVVKDGLLKTR